MERREPKAAKAKPSVAEYLLYIAKCVAGAAVSQGLYAAFPRHPLYWATISVLLVLDADERESMRLAVDRMKANVAGAAVGVAFILLLGSVGTTALLLAVVATIGLCHAIRLGKATRSALAALVIVTVSGPVTWRTGLERMACVVIGCVIGMAMTALGSVVACALPSVFPAEQASGTKPGDDRR